MSRGLTIIPFRIEDVPPSKSLEYFMSAPHWLDALTPPLARHLNHLSDAVKRILSGEADGSPPQPAAVAKAVPRGHRSWIAGGALGTVAIGAVGALLFLHRPPTAEAPADAPLLLDFGQIATASAPNAMVAAAPYLHHAAIRTDVTNVSPADSSLVFVNNSGLYDGTAVTPTVSQNFLTLEPVQPVPNSFTLSFSEPVAELSFVVPRLFPASKSGVTFPAFSAVALDPAGEPLASVQRGLTRSLGEDVPAQTFTLRAPGFTGISAVRFDSDLRLNGKPFAAFRALLIEQMSYRRMSRARVTP